MFFFVFCLTFFCNFRDFFLNLLLIKFYFYAHSIRLTDNLNRHSSSLNTSELELVSHLLPGSLFKPFSLNFPDYTSRSQK